MSNILYTSFAHCSSFEGNKYYMNTKIFSKEMLKEQENLIKCFFFGETHVNLFAVNRTFQHGLDNFDT